MLISIFFSALILLGIITYLYYTNRLDYLYNLKWNLLLDNLTKFEKWILSGSVIAVIIFYIPINLISSFIYGLISPDHTEEILKKQDELKKVMTELSENRSNLVKRSNIDPRDIKQYLDKLSIKDDKGETENKIDEWYQKRKISADEKELLLVAVSSIFEHKKVLPMEIENLKLKGQTDVAELLENVQKYFLEGDANKIKAEYFSRKEKIQKDNIIILEQSIKATEVLFAFQETIDLYKELVSLEPSAKNYYQFAYLLQKLNYFSDAANYYQEALKIYRELAKENPRTYLPDVAGTLNNLAVLHSDKNEFPQALEKYEEALKIYRELAKENPRTYEIKYARMLIRGNDLFRKDKNVLKDAKKLLEKYPNIYRAKKLLERLKELK